MSTLQEQNKAVVQRFNYEFIQGGDEEVFAQTVSRDFVNHSAQPGTSNGYDGAFEFFTKFFRPAFDGLVVTIHDQYAEGDTVVTRKSYVATHAAPFMGIPTTGKKITFSAIDIITLKDGKYVEHWVNPDLMGLHAQLTA